MDYKPLSKLFYSDKENYEAIYQKRFNSEYTAHIDFEINGFPAFFVFEPELYHKTIEIYKIDKRIKELRLSLPGKAIDQFVKRCLIDEIVLTNDIEGVYSSRREINSVLSDLKKKSKGKRFRGLVQKYYMLQKGETLSFDTCRDIRALYDVLVYDEIAEDDPDNLPDGDIFRKDSASVNTAAQKEIHRGVYPESKIIKCMDQALAILNSDKIEYLFKVALFHYLFGYIHPFYDGNGRTSRFISSYMLSKEFESTVAYRLSYTIKENISEYYRAFKTCNDKQNKGDLTPFIIMFVNIIEDSMRQLEDALLKRYHWLEHYFNAVQCLPYGLNTKYIDLYFLLIQASLFSEVGIGTQELIDALGVSRSTLSSRLNALMQKGLLNKKSFGNIRCYSLNLEKADEYADKTKEAVH